MNAPNDVMRRVHAAWAVLEAPPAEDMANLEWGSGRESAQAFGGIRPVDVDIDSVGFQSATPLFELPARAAAAYLGTYLISLLDGLAVQHEVGFAVDIATRSHTLAVLLAPHFWPDIAAPYLPRPCLQALGEVADLLIREREPLTLTDDEVAKLERLGRSIRRTLGGIP